MKKIITYLELLRIKQWVKNGFIFMPIIFGGKLYNIPDLINVFFIFGIYCLASSGVYIMNDLKDIAQDRFHPKKKNRPLASGDIAINQAIFISIMLVALSLALSYLLNKWAMLIILLYIALHFFYTYGLKKTIIIDVFSVSLGFELRIWAGAVVLNILPSIWLQLCVFVLAIFLGFIKRRHEKLILYEKAAEHRGVLAHYTPYLLDQMIMISASLCIIFYVMYVLSEDVTRRIGNNYIAYTIPLVVYGIFRYLYLVHVRKLGGDPGEILTSDFPFVVDILLWILSVILILYVIG